MRHVCIYMYICVCLYVQICIDGCIHTSETPVLAAGDGDVSRDNGDVTLS